MAKTTTAKCPNCNQALYPGIQHVCPGTLVAPVPVQDNGLKVFLLKLAIPLILLTITEIGGGIWWASHMASAVENLHDQMNTQIGYLKEELANQQNLLDKLDSYFRRPPPQ